MHPDGFSALFVAVPLIVALAAGVLRVDEHLFTSEDRRSTQPRRRPRFAVTDEDGEKLFTDPDGRTIPSRTR